MVAMTTVAPKGIVTTTTHAPGFGKGCLYVGRSAAVARATAHCPLVSGAIRVYVIWCPKRFEVPAMMRLSWDSVKSSESHSSATLPSRMVTFLNCTLLVPEL